jgi:hypothetical protein
MRTLLTALTALMLFATPVVAGDLGDAEAAYNAGDYEKAFRLWKPLAEQGNVLTFISNIQLEGQKDETKPSRDGFPSNTLFSRL